MQEHQRHGFSHDVAAAQNHRPLAFNTDAGGFDHLNDAFRRASFEDRIALDKPSDVIRVKTVGIFVGRDGVQHHLAVNLLGERKLHQDAMNLGVPVDLVDQGQELLLRCACR